MDSTSQMWWHFENITNDDVLRHPIDGKTWKHFDSVYPKFAAEPIPTRSSGVMTCLARDYVGRAQQNTWTR